MPLHHEGMFSTGGTIFSNTQTVLLDSYPWTSRSQTEDSANRLEPKTTLMSITLRVPQHQKTPEQAGRLSTP